MKKTILLIGFVIGFYSLVQSQSWISSNQIFSDNSVFEIDSDINSSGEVFSFGYFEGTLTSAGGEAISSYGGRDYFLIKFLIDGKVDWMYNIGSNLNDFITGGISVDNNDDIIATGTFLGHLKYTPTDSIESSGSFDIFLMKFDIDGNVLWARNAGAGAKLQSCTALDVDNIGDILMAGYFIDSINIYDAAKLYSDNAFLDYYYAKFNSTDGNIQWIRHARSLNTKSGTITRIAHGADYYLLTGLFADSIGFENDTIVPYNDQTDVHFIKTNLSGNIEWIRKISGNLRDLSYSTVADDENNLYVAGYYESDTLLIDESDNESLTVIESYGSYDIFIAKYLSNGNLEWYRTMGGKGEERVFDVEFFDNKVYLSGFFTDTMNWGGIQLTSTGTNDRDMFTGALDKQGNFREANKFAGRNNSTEEARGLFQNGDALYTIMRSNSDLIVLGDSIYTSDGVAYNMYIGIISCLPISVDNVIVSDVETCYGDSTGSIQVLVTGGFGSPWQYSIDNGLSYQADVAFFPDLPAGDYPVVVIDKENCAQPGPTVSIVQPDTLMIELIRSADITADADGEIQVAASGGTTPYIFTLQPTGLQQGLGLYTFSLGEEGTYLVEVNDGQDCGPVAIDSIEIRNTVGVDYSSILNAKIYPNPTSGMITLEMAYEGSECTLEVLSLTGQVVMSRQVYSTGGVLRETIDVSDLSKGMYMLRVAGHTLRSSIVVN